MRLLALASIPLGLIVAWVIYRAIAGRPVRRFALNSVVAVVLLAYFAITAGLGIFWVANQELPVFDPHYLFGYLTLALVGAHVWINFPLLVRFAKRRSKAMSADGHALRPTVRWAARMIGFVLFGGVCFWFGLSRGSSQVTVDRIGVTTERSEKISEIREQIVESGGARIPLSRWYFDHSILSRTRNVVRAPSADWSTRPAAFEIYPSQAITPLGERQAIATATGTALDDSRTAAPTIGAIDVTLRQLSALLHSAQGITEVSGMPGDKFYKRAAASSGALYPTVTHVVVGQVQGVAPGLYHYEPQTHALHRIREGDVRRTLGKLVAQPLAVEQAPFTVVLSAIYYKSSWKYQERGYRYCMLDAGHVAANAIVAGRALGFASRSIARFDDVALGELLGIERQHQGPLLVLPFGASAALPGDPDRAALEPAFEPVDLALANSDVPTPVMLMASRTALRATRLFTPPPPVAPPLLPRTAGTATPLAHDLHGDALGVTIERRRSQRRFGGAPITKPQLAAILGRAVGPSIEGQHAMRVHVIALRVDGLAAGAYEYRPSDATLIAVRDGDLASEIHSAALSQEVAAGAAALLVFSADSHALAKPDGSRGFRYAWLDIGVAAGRVYLQAVALRLGASSIGAFFDDDLVDLLHLDGKRDLPSLVMALGPP